MLHVFRLTIISLYIDNLCCDLFAVGLHLCWRRMLETKYVDGNYKMLVTVLAILITICLH